MYLRHGQVMGSHRILWDVITYPCLRYLPLAPKSSYKDHPKGNTDHPAIHHRWLVGGLRIFYFALFSNVTSVKNRPGGWFNIKIPSYQYRKSHCGDKTILRPSYLHNGISYTGKTTSLYYIRAQTLNFDVELENSLNIIYWTETLVVVQRLAYNHWKVEHNQCDIHQHLWFWDSQLMTSLSYLCVVTAWSYITQHYIQAYLSSLLELQSVRGQNQGAFTPTQAVALRWHSGIMWFLWFLLCCCICIYVYTVPPLFVSWGTSRFWGGSGENGHRSHLLMAQWRFPPCHPRHHACVNYSYPQG